MPTRTKKIKADSSAEVTSTARTKKDKGPTVADVVTALNRASEATSVERAQAVFNQHIDPEAPAADVSPAQRKAAIKALNELADEHAAPASPVAETTASWALTADQARDYRTVILLAHAESDDGEMPGEALEKCGAQHPLGWHPEVCLALINEGLLIQEDALTVLTGAGWKRVTSIHAEAHVREIAKKDSELAAHRDYANGEQQLLLIINQKTKLVEAAKGSLTLAKEGLKAAHEDLAAHCAGGPQQNGVQQSLLHVPGVMPPTASQLEARWKKILPSVPVDNVVVYDGPDKGLPEQKEVLDAMLLPIVFEGDKRVIAATKVLKIMDTPCIVTACWHEETLKESRANLTRLYTLKEWASRFAATLGQSVEGQDQTDTARAQRQEQGAFCGLQIRVGNKTMVVGPQSQALHIIHPAPYEAPVQAEPGFDARAAAAGDGPDDDEDDHKSEGEGAHDPNNGD